MPYEQYVLNVRPKYVRKKLEGKNYLVVDTAMMPEGVYSGNNGPILYLCKEMRKNKTGWNHKPAVINHPKINGRSALADQPEVLEEFRCGFLLGTKVDNKLRTKTWFDEDKLKEMDPGLYNRIINGDPVNVSTGMILDIETRKGTFNGKKYVGIARNIRPDHLAILPRKKGAASVEDGAGCFILNEKGKDAVLQVIDSMDGKKVKAKNIARRIIEALTITNDKSPEKKEMNEKKKMVTKLITNSDGAWTEEDREYLMDLDEERLERFLEDAKKAKKAPKSDKAAKEVVNEDTEEEEDDEEEEVVVVNTKKKKKDKKAPKKKIKVEVENEDEDDEDDDEEVVTKKKKAKKLTLNDHLAKIREDSPEIAEVLSESLEARNQERDKLVTNIMADPDNIFTEKYLRSPDRKITELRGIAALVTNKKRKKKSTEEDEDIVYNGSDDEQDIYIGGGGGALTTNDDDDDMPIARDLLAMNDDEYEEYEEDRRRRDRAEGKKRKKAKAAVTDDDDE